MFVLEFKGPELKLDAEAGVGLQAPLAVGAVVVVEVAVLGVRVDHLWCGCRYEVATADCIKIKKNKNARFEKQELKELYGEQNW